MTVCVRHLREAELAAADEIFRVAFGTFLRLPEPRRFGGDTEYVRTRWKASPSSAFAADSEGALAGSNFATRWGSCGFFGPLSIRPELWDRGIGRRLVEPVMAKFDEWQATHRGLYTFADSPKHHTLYQKFGFYPRFLTAILTRSVEDAPAVAGVQRFSEVPLGERSLWLERCCELTGSIYEGLDVAGEILAVADQGLGDTLLLDPQATRLTGLAVCHLGAGSEAGSGTGYVKFGAVRSGPSAEHSLVRLVEASGALARSAGATRLVAGVNLGRERAYRSLLAQGFRAALVGVAMESGSSGGYNRPDVFALDDWR